MAFQIRLDYCNIPKQVRYTIMNIHNARL